MYSATFIFDKKQFDDEFHQLDQAIAEMAKRTTAIWARKLGKTREPGGFRMCITGKPWMACRNS